MTAAACGCPQGDHHRQHAAGPTTCMASPAVIASIRSQISSGGVLSAADARLATLAGMLDIPPVGRSGFNDGVIYPPTDTEPVLAAVAGRRPTARLALAPARGKVTLNCLVLLVDFSDN